MQFKNKQHIIFDIYGDFVVVDQKIDKYWNDLDHLSKKLSYYQYFIYINQLKVLKNNEEEKIAIDYALKSMNRGNDND